MHPRSIEAFHPLKPLLGKFFPYSRNMTHQIRPLCFFNGFSPGHHTALALSQKWHRLLKERYSRSSIINRRICHQATPFLNRHERKHYRPSGLLVVSRKAFQMQHLWRQKPPMGWALFPQLCRISGDRSTTHTLFTHDVNNIRSAISHVTGWTLQRAGLCPSWILPMLSEKGHSHKIEAGLPLFLQTYSQVTKEKGHAIFTGLRCNQLGAILHPGQLKLLDPPFLEKIELRGLSVQIVFLPPTVFTAINARNHLHHVEAFLTLSLQLVDRATFLSRVGDTKSTRAAYKYLVKHQDTILSELEVQDEDRPSLSPQLPSPHVLSRQNEPLPPSLLLTTTPPSCRTLGTQK